MDGIRLLLLFLFVIFASCASTGVSSDYGTSPEVNNLRNYLRIRAMHPNVNYDESIDYLKRQADSLGLPYQVMEVLSGKPVLVMSWQGTEPALSSVLLNSHMDVVPVFEKSWNHPPFEAFMDDNGTIYGRGIQDMKSVAIQYIEAVRRLKASGLRLKRTLHLSFVPDEEIGGHTGMEKFVTTDQYKHLNVGFSLDEGMASETDDYIVFYAERSIWHMTVHCPGKSGHGSLLHNNTAGEKIRYVIDKLLDLREENKRRLESDPDLTVGDVTTINLTKLGGGIQANVVPEVLSATFDIRLALSVNHTEFEDRLNTWFKEAGEGITYEFVQKEPYVAPTNLGDDNPYWVAFRNVAQQLKLSLKKRIFPGGTDSRYIRALGVPCFGFSPMTNTRLQLHEHNESLKASTFLHGISLYEKIIPALLNTWFKEAGEGITYEFVQKEPYVAPTNLGDDNPYWVAFGNVAQQLKLSLKKRIFPGGTDSRYIRALGVPCLGFSPMTNTRLQLHEHNESLKASTFLHGISLYENIIPALANV